MPSADETFTATCRTSVESPPDIAFSAWTDPRLLEAWMGYRESGGDGLPRLVAVRNVQIAPVAGAAFRLDMITREADGTERVWIHHGEVVDVSPPASISLTWISEGTEGRPTRLDLQFSERDGGGTEVLLQHGGFTTDDAARAHAEGWELFLELFSEAMTTAITAGAKLVLAEFKRRLAERGDRSSDAADPS